MKDITQFLLKPTIEAIYDILHMENCKVNGIAGVPAINRLSMSPGHIDLEFDATFQAMHASTYIGYLPAIMLETSNGAYKIPQYTAQFEGCITMGGARKNNILICGSVNSLKRLWLKGILIIGVSFIQFVTMSGS